MWICISFNAEYHILVKLIFLSFITLNAKYPVRKIRDDYYVAQGVVFNFWKRGTFTYNYIFFGLLLGHGLYTSYLAFNNFCFIFFPIMEFIYLLTTCLIPTHDSYQWFYTGCMILMFIGTLLLDINW